MSTIALTPEQTNAKEAFAALLTAGCQTKIGGFTFDTAVAGQYIIDPSGTKLLYRANLAKVDLAVLNPSIRPAAGTVALPVIESWQFTWDMNGVCQKNPDLSLVQVVS